MRRNVRPVRRAVAEVVSGVVRLREDPILKFMLIMAIVLAAPLLLNKLRIPYLLGLIIAGAVIGPHGLNLVLRDSSIILSGKMCIRDRTCSDGR